MESGEGIESQAICRDHQKEEDWWNPVKELKGYGVQNSLSSSNLKWNPVKELKEMLDQSAELLQQKVRGIR